LSALSPVRNPACGVAESLSTIYSEAVRGTSPLQDGRMDLEKLEELVVLAAALAVGALLAVVDPDRMPERLRSWALALGKFRQLIGVCLVLAAVALALFH
jgi:hypothetical protein